MLKRLNTTKLISIGILATILFGCGTTPAPVKPTQSQLSLVSAPLQPIEYLNNAANTSNPEQQARYLLLAAHAFINNANTSAATKALNSAKTLLGQNTELLAEYKYLTARVLELTSTYDDALRELNYPSQWQLADWQMVAYYQFKAHLYQEIKQPIEQARQLSLLSVYLPRAQANEVNDKIWHVLQPMHEQTLLDFSHDSATPIFAGWLQLAYIAKHYAINPNELVQHLGKWQYTHPDHPGAIKLPTDLEKALNAKPYRPQNIAVLLPLSGNKASIASSVRQGIMSRYVANPSNKVTINFFDTAEGAHIAYQKAVSSGAEFIIGPLFQSEVEQLQQPTSIKVNKAQTDASANLQSDTQTSAMVEPTAITHQIPQLYLNNIDTFTPNDDIFYFALSPANEANDTAEKLFADGITTPLILASNNAIGHRMAESFNEQWTALTKKTAEVHFYDEGDQMKTTVQKSLGVTDSKERIARIKALLGNKIEADFRSRRDIDAIYMISDNRELPLLKPFIDVNFSVFADPVPLYASSRSRVKDSSRTTALELNNLNISDIPWLLTNSPEADLVTSLWPTWSYSQKRLYIMGYDALELIGKLAQMRALPGYQFSGRSGMLSVSPDGIINRQLSWGRYQRGSLRPQ
ncbi:penicillin-binding protein activator [Shewanella sp. VB17]|uniref:penicillin-binding protein activator n=1 Tax=Shewanella sp. VB17 TaxID=2739432 RepID=UPI0015658CD1|nr:penicillin-binding protein activator [Shewanella sp. VB17]NRD75663.1 penicillin-binding protein activator [Shewanella sp. VB17]